MQSEFDARLLIALHLSTLIELPGWSAAPRGESASVAHALMAAGYSGVQGTDDPAFSRAGLVTFGSGRVGAPHEVDSLIAAQADAGHAATTLHVGTGFEGDLEAFRLLEAVLKVSSRYGHPTYVETHRATLTQDIWRTLRWVEYFPELEFNADLSHWYTGLQLTNGNFEEKLGRMAPVFARTGFIHARIGTAGTIQTSIGIGGRDEPHVSHFKTMWRECFRLFVQRAEAGRQIVFMPELLASVVNTPTGPVFKEYAQTQLSNGREPVETSDRWDQALKLVSIAVDLFGSVSREVEREPEQATCTAEGIMST